MIRRILQEGKFRHIASIGLGAVAVYILHYLIMHVPRLASLVPEAVQKAAFVAAAFGVTAYNLRTRVIDFVLKLKVRPRRMDEICNMAKECGKRLTHLVLLFTLTACFMAGGNFLKDVRWISDYWPLASAFLFVSSSINFIYIVFGFERLEAFILDEHKELAEAEEADRLTKEK